MSRESYSAGPAAGAEVRKNGDTWTLVLVRDLHHPPATVWHALTEPDQMGAAGWHICFDVLENLLAGDPVGRIVGGEAMRFGWPCLHAEYAAQFGAEGKSPPPTA